MPLLDRLPAALCSALVLTARARRQHAGHPRYLYAFAEGSWTIVVLTNYDPPIGDDFAWGLCEFLARQ